MGSPRRPSVEQPLVPVAEFAAAEHKRVLQPDERLPPHTEVGEHLGELQEVRACGPGDLPDSPGLGTGEHSGECTSEKRLQLGALQVVALGRERVVGGALLTHAL